MSQASSPTPTDSVGVDSNASGQDDDRKQESEPTEELMVQSEHNDALEDGELEEGELDDDDQQDDDINNSSESKNQPCFNGLQVNEHPENQQPPKPKAIPSLFDLKTTKPKSKKALAEEKGKKTFLKYVDHDRIADDDYMEYERSMSSAWPGYAVPNDEYDSSECELTPEDEYSMEIQQMLQRSAPGASHGAFDNSLTERSPRGPYDSPSEDEEDADDGSGCPPPAKLQKVEDGCVSHGLTSRGIKKATKKMLMGGGNIGAVNNSDTDGFIKKVKLTTNKTRKIDSAIKVALELGLPEKRRLADTPMEERPQCKFYMEGKCKKGANCPFNHDVKRPIKSEVCKFYLSGQCSKGKDCTYSHDVKNTGDEGDGQEDAQVPKKRKALLGSPPALQPRIMQSNDKKKIPSLFDIHIDAEGPNAKEKLQSAARRSVMMRSSNPKPGLLGVAPPNMIPAGMMGFGMRMRFPVGQGFYENFNRSQTHEVVKEGQDASRKSPTIFDADFDDLESLPAQQNSMSSMESDLPEQTNTPVKAEMISQSSVADYSCTSVTSGSMITVVPFAPQNNLCSEPQAPASTFPSSLNPMSDTPRQSLLPSPSSSPSNIPPSAHNIISSVSIPPVAVSSNNLPEVNSYMASAASPTNNENEKPQIIGGIDVNHLPPKQRELYLRMFANQKNNIPADVPMVTGENHTVDDVSRVTQMLKSDVAISDPADLFKILIPAAPTLQSVGQPFSSDAIGSQQPSSSGAMFDLNHMLSFICGGGKGGVTANSHTTSSPESLSFKDLPPPSSPEPVFEVFGSRLQGLYRLEPVTLDSEIISLPAYITDPSNAKWSVDPRVQKHKNDVIVPPALEQKDEQAAVVATTEAGKVQSTVLRRDPRLARKEAMAKEDGNQQGTMPQSVTAVEALKQSGILVGNMQQVDASLGGMQQACLSMCGLPMQQARMPLGSMSQVVMSVGGMQQGRMPLLNMPVGGMQGSMPVSGLPQGGLFVGNIQQGGMSMGSVQQGNMQQGGMQVGGMQQQSGMQVGGMQQQSGMQMAGMVQQQHQGGMQMGGMQQQPQQQGGMKIGGMQQQQQQQQQGGMQMGGMQQQQQQQGGMQMGGMQQQGSMQMGGMQQQGGMQMGSMQQQGGMQMGGVMRQRMNLPMSGGMLQPGSLPARGLLQSFMQPLVQNQMNANRSMSTMNPFHAGGGQAQFGFSRPGMIPNEMNRVDSQILQNGGLQSWTHGQPTTFPPGSAVQESSVSNVFVFGQPIKSNPRHSGPLLPTPEVHMPSNISDSSLEANGSLSHQNCSASIPISHQMNEVSQKLNDSILDESPSGSVLSAPETNSGNSPSAPKEHDRTSNYRVDQRFRIKKARIKDDKTENSAANKGDLDNSPKSDVGELDADTRRTVVRNKDKLEFRSPLADMGECGSLSFSSSYNQPPNKKYQQLAEENNLRRSTVIPKTSASDTFKRKTVAHQAPSAANDQISAMFSNRELEVKQDPVMDSDSSHTCQSIKDMFKSIDPTASPFC